MRRSRTELKKKKPGYKVKAKHTFRVRAHDLKSRLRFFKTRTKQPLSTIKRVATLQGLEVDRIT